MTRITNEISISGPIPKLTGLRPSPTSMLRQRAKDEQNLTHSHQLLPLKVSRAVLPVAVPVSCNN